MSSINLIKQIDKTEMLWNGITILINYFLFAYFKMSLIPVIFCSHYSAGMIRNARNMNNNVPKIQDMIGYVSYCFCL